MEKTLIIGLGNSLRYDDAVGIIAVRKLQERLNNSLFEIRELSETGLQLLSLMEDYNKVIIIDSFATAGYAPGYIHRYDFQQLMSMSQPYSSHQLSLPTMLRMAQLLQMNIPKTIVIYGLEIEKNDAFGEGLSLKVNQALPHFLTVIEQEVSGYA